MTRTLWLALWLSLFYALSPRLSAQGPAPSGGESDAEPLTGSVVDGKASGSGEAERLFNHGLAAIGSQRYGEAVAHLDASYRLAPQPFTMYALGIAYNGLGYPDKAVEAFAAYVDLAVAAGRDPHWIADVQGEVTRLSAQLSRFRVRLQPADLSLRVDGQAAQPREGQLWLRPGRHQVEASAPGFEPFEQELEVREGRFELDIQLRPLWASPEQVAAALCREGAELSAAGDVLSAVERFDRARALDPTPEALGQAGLARAQLGEFVLAAELLGGAVATAEDPWVKAHHATLAAELLRSERRLGRVLLTARAEYRGGRVWLSGRFVGRLPEITATPLSVEAGSVTVRVAMPGYQEFRRDVEVAPDSNQAVSIQLDPSQPVALALRLPPLLSGITASAAKVAAPSPSPDTQPPRSAGALSGRVAVGGGSPVATGLELSVSFGYEIAVRNGLGGAAGGVAARLFSIGYRPVWPLSFGVHLLSGVMNLSQEGTRFVGALYPALYVRGHSQRLRGALTWDLWGGLGFVPLAMGLVLHESRAQGVTALDASQVEDPADLITSVAQEGTGVRDAVTTQSFAVPLELGVSLYLTPGVALSFSSALTFHTPVQQCYFVELSGDHVCYESGLRPQTDLYLGFGLSLLP